MNADTILHKEKIFILVYREPYEGDTVHGVYTTYEKATIALKDLDNQYPHRSEHNWILAVTPDEKPNSHNVEAVV